MKKFLILPLIMLLINNTVFAGEAAVVAPEPLAAETGIKILKKGGNAFDAAVAIGFTLAVTYPRAGNIGGGGFAMLFSPGSEPIALDFRETAPLMAHEKMYLDKNGNVIDGMSTKTALGAGVPGTVKGLYEIWEKYGSLEFDSLLEDAINLAEKGYLVSENQSKKLKKYEEKLVSNPVSKTLFFKENAMLKPGDRLIQKNLAASLKAIGCCGESDFYRGRLGHMFIKDIQSLGGIITSEDLEKYRVKWRTPVRTEFRGDTLYLMPLPSSGGIVIAQILNMLTHFDLESLTHNSFEYITLLCELEKRSYADRNTYLGDPEHFPVYWEKLLDKNYITSRIKSIKPGMTTDSPDIQPGYGTLENSTLMLQESDNTTSFAVTDSHGNAVSITYTLNGNYGSGITLKTTGILLNNEMDDFSSKPGVPNMFGLVGGQANSIQPGKRMLSSMTPAIVLKNGCFKMALGSPGGSRIITTVLQTYLNHTLFGMSASDSVNSLRYHHQWLPDEIRLEEASKQHPELIKKLEKAGNTLHFVEEIGDSIMILDKNTNGRLDASADNRGSGVACLITNKSN